MVMKECYVRKGTWLEGLTNILATLEGLGKGAYVGMLEDNKYKKVHCVRECKLSCRRIRLGKVISEAGAYVGMLEDNKYKKVHCVRECKLSCRRIRLGKVISEAGLRVIVAREVIKIEIIKGLIMWMFPKESDKIVMYIDGLPKMIHAKNKRKLKDTSKNNKNQQQNKKQNTGRVYTTGSSDKKPYGGSKPLCSKCNYHYDGSKPLCFKCNYHHDGQCAPKCHKCNRVGHLARNRKSTVNGNTANNQRGTRACQKPACFECEAQGHFKRECPKLKNKNHELGSFDVIIGMDWLAKYHAVIVCAEKIVRIPWEMKP
nr:hypothetical protein [Tanacetum cinerariifolium]